MRRGEEKNKKMGNEDEADSPELIEVFKGLSQIPARRKAVIIPEQGCPKSPD